MSIHNTYPVIKVDKDLRILTSGRGDYCITVESLQDFILNTVQSSLPVGASEGDTLVYKNGVWVEDVVVPPSSGGVS